ncbi:hypothetical protein ACIQ6K_34830 [Streptomyces sp. NPDC096354]
MSSGGGVPDLPADAWDDSATHHMRLSTSFSTLLNFHSGTM